METNENRPPALASFRTVDAIRGMLITVIIGIVGYFVIVPAPDPAPGGFSMTHTGLSMLLIGAVLQLAIIFGRPLIARFERAQGLPGQVSLMAIHVMQLLADGLTVLLFALAVFGGISRFENGI
jgi:hypothetical protein